VNEFQNAVLLEGHETDVEIPHNVKMHAQKGKNAILVNMELLSPFRNPPLIN
jgi:hypothetical protein